MKSNKLIIALLTIATLCFTLALTTESKAGTNAQRYYALKNMEGLHERKHTRRISRNIGVNPRVTPWCGACINYANKVAGKKRNRNGLRASTWNKYGKAVSYKNARKGDIVTRRSRYAGSGFHVGVVGKKKNGRVYVCSCNTGNRVKCNWWKRYHRIRR